MLGIIFIIIAYFLGSLNSAVLVCKALKLTDPRTEGSQNPGAANVYRLHGKKAAILTLVGDALKGFLPVLLARLLGVEDFMLAMVGLAAVVGHIFPAFFGFKGGKGVATAFGVMLALSFWVGLLTIIIWGVIVYLTKYSSLASLAASILAAIFILFVHASYFLPVAIIVGLIIWRHWDNIMRLKDGTENKMQF